MLALPDHALARQMFVNFRSGAGSQRLTLRGIDLMRQFFVGFQVVHPDPVPITNRQLVYLSRATTLPFYCSDREIVIYDRMLGALLVMAGGNLTRLIELDS